MIFIVSSSGEQSLLNPFSYELLCHLSTNLTSLVKDLFTDSSSLLPSESSFDSADHETSNNNHMRSGINESTTDTTTNLTSLVKDLFTDCPSLLPSESSSDSADHDTSNNTHIRSGINESTICSPLPVDKTDLTSLVIISLTPLVIIKSFKCSTCLAIYTLTH